MTTPIPHLEEAMAELRKRWPSDDSFSLGLTGKAGFYVTLHYHGVAYSAATYLRDGDTFSDLFAAALAKIPTPKDAAKERLARAWAELRAAEAAAGEAL